MPPAATTPRSRSTATSGAPTAWRFKFATTSRAFGRPWTRPAKSPASDVARRKWTFPVVWAIAQPPSAARDAIADAYALGTSARRALRSNAIVAALDDAGCQRGRARVPPPNIWRSSSAIPTRGFRDFLLETLDLVPRVLERNRRERATASVRAAARQSARVVGAAGAVAGGFIVRLAVHRQRRVQNRRLRPSKPGRIALAEHGFATFYSSIGFADYPPGYFYILAAVGHFWQLLFAAHDHGYAVLRVLVKLPAIFADLCVGALLYALVRRFAGVGLALGAAALYLLNPATIYNSARGDRSTRSRVRSRCSRSTRSFAAKTSRLDPAGNGLDRRRDGFRSRIRC